jgi:lipooligosaccharide transport system ATP-binding protein
VTTVGPPALRLRGVTKRFGDLLAVDHLDLDVPRGICLGLLGPNGAGKSTTMRMVTAQVRQDAGTIEVLGHPVPHEAKQARARMGVVPQQDNLDGELTVRQNLEVFGRLYRIPQRELADAVERALALAQLVERQHTTAEQLSGGMKRRLLIARGLVHRPELVLLDEPTVGLDPQVRSDMWGMIDALRSGGVTIVMSTHYIEEAHRLADEVAMMSHGRIVATGAPQGLVATHAGPVAHEFYGPPARLAEVEAAADAAGVAHRRTGPSVSLIGHPPPEWDGRFGDPVRREATLEDVFVLLTGEAVE